MATDLEYRCFIGGLSWNTSDRDLEEAFRPFGQILEAKVVVDKGTGRSKGFGFVTFGNERAMEDAIDRMHGINLDGRSITVAPSTSTGGGDRGYGGGGGRGAGGGSQDCFKCGKPGHWARECPNGSGGGRRSGDRYGYSDRYGSSDKYRNNRDHDSKGGDRYSSGSRYGSDRNNDRYGRTSPNREANMRGNGERHGGRLSPNPEASMRGTGDRSGRSNKEAGMRGNDDYHSAGGPSRSDWTGYRDRSGPYDRPSGRDSGRR